MRVFSRAAEPRPDAAAPAALASVAVTAEQRARNCRWRFPTWQPADSRHSTTIGCPEKPPAKDCKSPLLSAHSATSVTGRITLCPEPPRLNDEQPQGGSRGPGCRRSPDGCSGLLNRRSQQDRSTTGTVGTTYAASHIPGVRTKAKATRRTGKRRLHRQASRQQNRHRVNVCRGDTLFTQRGFRREHKQAGSRILPHRCCGIQKSLGKVDDLGVERGNSRASEFCKLQPNRSQNLIIRRQLAGQHRPQWYRHLIHPIRRAATMNAVHGSSKSHRRLNVHIRKSRIQQNHRH